MQFTGMTIWAFAGLAAATAAVLAVLQYLRIRPNRLRVVTTLFWQRAAEEARARTLLERFRHPRTYLLLLVICLLLLLALARPVFRSGDRPYRVIVLEAGLAMTTDDNRFDNARALVRSEAAAAGEDRVAVIVADPIPRVIKRFDESLGVMKCRLAGLQPAQELIIREEAVRIARSYLDGRGTGEIVTVAAQPPAEKSRGARVLAAGDVYPNAFILAACFIPSAPDPMQGEFCFTVGYSGRESGTVTIEVEGAQVSLVEETVDLAPGSTREFRAPVAADGSSVTVTLSGDDAVVGDSHLLFRLPKRKQMLIKAEGLARIPQVLQSVVASLAEATTDSQAFSGLPVIRVGALGTGVEIEIHTSAADDWGPVTSTDHPLVSGLAFEDAVCRVPRQALPVEAGHIPLLHAGGIAVAVISPDGKRLTVSDVILDPEASLVRRTGYLVFWSRALRHLADWDHGTVALPPTAVRATGAEAEDRLLLKADMANFNVVTQGAEQGHIESARSRPPLWQLLLGIGIVLMTVEAVLNIRGRIA